MNKDPIKQRARLRLREAVYAGRIKKPKNCSRCKKKYPRRFIHGHHHRGYRAWSDMIWLCVHCHHKVEPVAKFGADNGMRKHPECSSFYWSNPQGKLTKEQVIELRRLAKSKTGKQLAFIFKISPSAVSQILLGKTWGRA